MRLKPQFIADALSAEDCAHLLTLAMAAPERPAGLVGGRDGGVLRRAGIHWLDDLPGAGFAMDRMIRTVAEVNRAAFQFDLTDFGESAQIARYGAADQGHFDWHSDIGAGQWAAQRKLTVVVQLSDPAHYQGGALQIQPDNTLAEAPRARGTAAIFPSFALHRVTPVTEGQRWSLTLWAHGPAFH